MSNKSSQLLGKEIKLGSEAIQYQLQYLQGRVLTIIEASLPQSSQLKAVKDLINQAFSEQLSYVLKLCYPEVGMVTTSEVESLTGRKVEDIEKEAEKV